jgi:hypothetical protein
VKDQSPAAGNRYFAPDRRAKWQSPRERTMAEKIKKLSLQRDYKQFLYFIDGEGNVCQKPKSGKGDSTVLVEKAVDRDNQFLYFIDKEGDVSRSPRGTKHKKAA